MTRTRPSSRRALMVWGSWGPYHHARFRAAREQLAAAGWDLEGIQMYSSSGIYAWAERSADHVHEIGLDPPEMQFRPIATLRTVVPLLIRTRPDIIFLPSYWHWSLMINVLARCVGARTIMMNETHGATSQPGRLRMRLKSLVVRRFGAAVVGGALSTAFFAEMGLSERRIFPGYDVVDNAHFIEVAAATRANQDEVRERHLLPDRYVLSLGRLVAKKNLGLLISAYADVRERLGDPPVDLVIVGEGDELDGLVSLCRTLGLAVVDRHPGRARAEDSAGRPTPGAVHFHPYASYSETPEYMALADVFVLPSRSEEWGLVVNEAMASGTSVLVSDAVGCTPDLCIDGSTAAVFPSDDLAALAAMIERLCTDHAGRKAIAAGGRRHIGLWGLDRFGRECVHAVEVAAG